MPDLPAWVPVLATFVLAVALAIRAGDRVADRVLGLLLLGSRRSAWLAVPLTIGYHLVVLALLLSVAVVGIGLSEDVGDGWLGALVGAVGVVLHVQLLWFAVPSRVSAYRDLREDLRGLGATVGQERAIAWTGGPLALLGLGGEVALLFALFG